MAKAQARLTPVPVDVIVKLINEFLGKIDLPEVAHPIMTDFKVDQATKNAALDYNAIKRDNDLNAVNHIVWLKFTMDKFLGVVASGNDCNFDIPPDPANYNDPGRQSRWQYNTSGILIDQLGKKWDERLLVVFPLPGITNKSKSAIDRGIGQYLLKHDVPILDYYSHLF
ncbi:hypothetical protein [Lapidilactobacillus achengensis]|nr:hypothetical protein [Lapidilactobacillus achengensis]